MPDQFDILFIEIVFYLFTRNSHFKSFSKIYLLFLLQPSCICRSCPCALATSWRHNT